MPFGWLYALIRAFAIVSAQSRRDPEEARARKAAKALARADREAAEEATEAQRRAAAAKADAELKFQREALNETIRRCRKNIGSFELTNALGFYVHHGASLSEAHRMYRSLLESGGYLPGRPGECIAYGRKLRQALDIPTNEERFQREATELRNDKLQAGFCWLLAMALVPCAFIALIFGGFDGFLIVAFIAGGLFVRAKILSWTIRARSHQ